MEAIDFTNCIKDNNKFYGGANGGKIGIIYNDKTYMLKFPPKARENQKISYINSSISEYISCKIIETLEDLLVQETILGTYTIKSDEKKIVCACRDFTTYDEELIEFAKLKNRCIETSNNGYGTELDEVLETIEAQEILPKEEIKSYFWKMFIIDALLGNFDRHNGNWGFLLNKKTGQVKMSPIFDCGSCLFPQITDERIEEIINNEEELEKRVYVFPNSALKQDGKKINYFTYINNKQNEEIDKAILEIYPKINLERINKVIDETPIISNIRKQFYKKIIKLRYEDILTLAYNNCNKKFD